MGFLQDTVWNNIFKYAYPLAFIGSISYGLLSIMNLEMTQIVGNKNWVWAYNIFFGICGVLSFAAWYNTDISIINNVTSYIDFDANKTKDRVEKQV